MAAFWLKPEEGKSVCVEAGNADAAITFFYNSTGIGTVRCNVLPYPAEPRFNRAQHPWGETPSFCYTPEKCKGNTSCPGRRSCTE